MKPTPLLLALTCLTALFVAADARGTKLSFAPAKGSKVRKTVEQSSEMKLESMTMTLNGEERDLGEMQRSVSKKESYVFVDEYTGVADGKLLGLTRTFEAAKEVQAQSMTTPRGEQNQEREATTELVGKTVAFAFDTEKDEWKREFIGEAGDEELLGGLEADFDLLGFLPGAEVSEGSDWEIDTRALANLFFPGGDLVMVNDEDPEGERAGQLAMREAFEGKGTATYKGLREEDGVSLALIAFEAEISSAWDVEREKRFGGGTEQRTIEMKLAGELTWNMAKQRAEHVTVEREGSLRMESKNSMSRGEQSFEIHTLVELALNGKDEVVFAPAE
ncbi:MAG: hypothetical protein FJ299_12085 [Planctomycetes bacterium]|nr:hypothetical protein [Planctomycetota bacterium]